MVPTAARRKFQVATPLARGLRSACLNISSNNSARAASMVRMARPNLLWIMADDLGVWKNYGLNPMYGLPGLGGILLPLFALWSAVPPGAFTRAGALAVAVLVLAHALIVMAAEPEPVVPPPPPPSPWWVR